MKIISRRQFLYISGLFSVAYPISFSLASSIRDNPGKSDRFPITITVLKSAYVSEMMAYKNYEGYSRKALEERYPNIAYLFSAFAVSEKTHADNYEKILMSLGEVFEEPELEVLVSDTKANLGKAAEKELIKIKKTYPDFLAELEKESHDESVISCMYSWKSHRQHEEKISQIQKYCKMLFGSVAKQIEGMKFNFHVCEICGSTIDRSPKTACEICNYPVFHYQKVMQPT